MGNVGNIGNRRAAGLDVDSAPADHRHAPPTAARAGQAGHGADGALLVEHQTAAQARLRAIDARLRPAAATAGARPSVQAAPADPRAADPAEVRRLVTLSRATGTMQYPAALPALPPRPSRDGADIAATLGMAPPRASDAALLRAIRDRVENRHHSPTTNLMVSGAHAAIDLVTAFFHPEVGGAAGAPTMVDVGFSLEVIGLALVGFEVSAGVWHEFENFVHNRQEPSSAVIRGLRDELARLEPRLTQAFHATLEARFQRGADDAIAGRPMDPGRANDRAYALGYREAEPYRARHHALIDQHAARAATVAAVERELGRVDPDVVRDPHPVRHVLTAPAGPPTVGRPLTLPPGF